MTLDFPFLQFLCWHGYFRYVKRFKVNLDNCHDLMFFWFYISLKKYYPPLNWLMFRMNCNVKWGYYTTFLWVSWKSCKSCIYTFWMRFKICIICFFLLHSLWVSCRLLLYLQSTSATQGILCTCLVQTWNKSQKCKCWDSGHIYLKLFDPLSSWVPLYLGIQTFETLLYIPLRFSQKTTR